MGRSLTKLRPGLSTPRKVARTPNLPSRRPQSRLSRLVEAGCPKTGQEHRTNSPNSVIMKGGLKLPTGSKRASRIPCSQNFYKLGPNLGKNAPPGSPPIKGSRLYLFEGPDGKDVIIREDFTGHPHHPEPHFNDPANNHYDYPGKPWQPR